jgi:hypothetical protein
MDLPRETFLAQSNFLADFLAGDFYCIRNRWRPPTAEQIISYNPDRSVRLRVDDIIIDEVKVDLTRGSSNPMDNVRFFHFAHSTDKLKMPRDQISSMFPMSCRVRSGTCSSLIPS